MMKILKALRNFSAAITTIGAVVAAAIVAIETYQGLRKKVSGTGSS